MEVKDYMKLPYTRLVQEMNDESGHYFYGRILELDGCQSTSDTLEELYESLNEAMEGYIETKIENNLSIPIPETPNNYSGKFVVRLPKSLHQRLAIEAEKEEWAITRWLELLLQLQFPLKKQQRLVSSKI